MSEPAPLNTRPQKAISLHPLSTDEALAAALRIRPGELHKLEEQEAAQKARVKKLRGR